MRLLNSMIFAAALSVSSLSAMADSPELLVTCNENIDGNQIAASLDSRSPSFSSAIKLSGMTNVELTCYLSATSVCGVEMDFAKQCSGEVRDFQGDREFSFKCQNGIMGEIILSGDAITFSCLGDSVKAEFKNAAFLGCKASQLVQQN